MNQRDVTSLRSERVVLDGVAQPALVELDRDVGAPTARVRSITPTPAATAAPPGTIDIGASLLVPAPLDLHFHGAGGHVVPPEGAATDIDAALQQTSSHAWHHDASGIAPVYEWIATLPIPQRPPADPVEHLADAARAISAAAPTTACRGLRLEGLFLNPVRAGVWPPEGFRAPDPVLLAELVAAAADAGSELLIVDVAPELPGALELIARAHELGVVVSLAHTDATWEQACAAIDAGATLATHTWNAMRGVSHRDPGVVAAALADERVTCELICDGVHLHPGTIALSAAACGPGGWVAISDASPFAGAAAGTYEWAGTTVTHDGVALRDHAGRLAGSASLLDRAPQVLASAGIGEIEAALALGADPRRVLDATRTRGLHIGDPVWIV